MKRGCRLGVVGAGLFALLLGGCTSPGPYVCTNQTDATVSLTIYEGASTGPWGTSPSGNWYSAALDPGKTWSSAGAEPATTDVIFGPTVIVLATPDTPRPLAFSFDADGTCDLRIRDDHGVPIIERHRDGLYIAEHPIEDDRYEFIISSFRRMTGQR